MLKGILEGILEVILAGILEGIQITPTKLLHDTETEH